MRCFVQTFSWSAIVAVATTAVSIVTVVTELIIQLKELLRCFFCSIHDFTGFLSICALH